MSWFDPVKNIFKTDEVAAQQANKMQVAPPSTPGASYAPNTSQDFFAKLAMAQSPQYSPEQQAEATRLRAMMEQARVASLANTKSSVDQYQNDMQQYQNESQPTDLRGLSALVDKWAGGAPVASQIAQAYVGEGADAKRKNLAEMSLKLAGLKAGMNAEQLANLKEQLDSLSQEGKAKAMAALSSGKLGTITDRFNQTVADKFDKHPTIMKLNNQKNQIEMDMHTLSDPNTILTPQIQNEITNGIANALSGGRTAAVTTMQKQEYSNISTKWAELQQKIMSKQVDVNTPEMRSQLIDVLKRLGKAYDQTSYSVAKKIAEGREAGLRNSPDAREVLKQKVESFKPAEESQPNGLAIGTIEDGHRYKGGDPANPSSWELVK